MSINAPKMRPRIEAKKDAIAQAMREYPDSEGAKMVLELLASEYDVMLPLVVESFGSFNKRLGG